MLYPSNEQSEAEMLKITTYSFSSVAQLCPTLCNPMDRSTPGLSAHHQLPELAQTHVHWISDAIHLSDPLLSPSPPALNLSQHQGLFKWVSSLHQVTKVLEFQLQHQSFQDWYSGLISFGIDGLDLLAVQGTLKSLLQHHSSKASVLQCSAFFMVQLHWYITTGKTIALTRQTFVGTSLFPFLRPVCIFFGEFSVQIFCLLLRLGCLFLLLICWS